MTSGKEAVRLNGTNNLNEWMEQMTRSINTIAQEIKADWKKINYGAVPYLDAMMQIDSINENYYCDTAESIIIYFLSNASTWHGPKAKEIKIELKSILKTVKRGY